MTLIEDRPVVDRPQPASRPERSTSPTASWRFASRLARREVRRRPGRTLLIMLLVALPVFGMSVAAITARTNDAAQGNSFQRQYGRADLQLLDTLQYSRGGDGEMLAVDNARLFDDGPQLPAGTGTLSYTETWTPITGLDANGLIVRPYVHFVIADASDPMVEPAFQIERGRAAAVAGEVMLTDDVAERFGVEVGDTLTLTRPDVTATVVGIHAESQWLNNSSIVLPGFDTTLLRPDSASVRTLVQLPPSSTDSDIDRLVGQLRNDGFEAESAANRGWEESSIRAEQLAWGWVAGVVAFIAVGIVIASAFATSARRQLATVGQLSANGAPERLVRRTLGLQGMWTGALGAVVGIGAAIAATIVAHRFEVTNLFTGYAVEQLRIPPLELIVVALTALAAATIAALVPARSASRIPVLSALAGRRPVSTPPRWLVPVGLALFGFGVFLIAGAAGSPDGGNFEAAIAVLGVLGVLFGIVCSSPLLVAWVSAVGSKRGGVTRIAARSLGRSRMRSAGVLTAIATVAAIAIAGLTAVDSVRVADQGYSTVENDDSAFEIWFASDSYAGAQFDEFGNPDPDFDPPPAIAPPLPVELRERIEAVLPNATWYELSSVVFDELPQSVYESPNVVNERMVVPSIADEVALSLLELTDEQQQLLIDNGILSTSMFVTGEVLVNSNGELVPIDAGMPVDQNEITTRIPSQFQPELLITPEFARSKGFDTQVSQVLIDNPTDFTDDERDELNVFSGFQGDDSFVVDGDDVVDDRNGQQPDVLAQWGYYVNGPNFEVPWAVIQVAVLAAALLMVLLVVAIGLSLAATESKDERDVLHAVGASPSTLRRVAAAKAWVLTTGAAAISIPTGYAVVRVITWANGETAPFPIVGALGIAIVIPAVAWAATLAVSAIAQKARPINFSTLTQD